MIPTQKRVKQAVLARSHRVPIYETPNSPSINGWPELQFPSGTAGVCLNYLALIQLGTEGFPIETEQAHTSRVTHENPKRLSGILTKKRNWAINAPNHDLGFGEEQRWHGCKSIKCPIA